MQKTHLHLAAIFLLFFLSQVSFSQSSDTIIGRQLFKSNCSACHSIGKGKVVGPDLAGVNQKRDEKWLIQWVHSSQSLVKSGDKDANAIFNEFNKIVMNDFAFLKDDEVKSILGYIETESKTALASATAPAASPSQAMVRDSAYHFTLFDYFFFSTAIILLLAAYIISRRITRFADQIGDMYENERAFFKK